MHKCTCCNPEKTYNSKKALYKHQRKYDANYKSQLVYDRNLRQYESNPKKCKTCNAIIVYEKRENIYCDNSCAAQVRNKLPRKTRGPMRTSSRIRLTNCLECNKSLLKSPNSKYCSKECDKINKRKQHAQTFSEGKLNNAQALRKHMLANNENKCMDPECVWDQEKRPVSLEVDHIDGNPENNLPSNLRLLCRNCHSLTSTYGVKNLGHGRTKRRQRYQESKKY